MIEHSNAKLMLYEYLHNELSSAEGLEIEAHLVGCKACSTELESLRQLVALFPRPATGASEEQSAEYWNQFASMVEQKVAHHERQRTRRNPLTGVADWVEELLVLRTKQTFAIGGVCTILVAALAFWTFLSRQDRDVSSESDMKANDVAYVGDPTTSGNRQRFTVPNERVGQYFRKSKTLLVGLANLQTGQDEPLDLATERRVSRDLIREARYLKRQPIDPRSRELMNNLERILIELGNIEEENDLPNVEIIRGGIRQENLLFKIRMAEAMYDSTRFVNTRDIQ